ncbi:uncharacterized protein METZ01_LOCUS213643, partial [marine metagenome]
SHIMFWIKTQDTFDQLKRYFFHKDSIIAD